MLKILWQKTSLDGYNIMLDNKMVLHLKNKNPTQTEITNLLAYYELDRLNEIDLLGEEHGV